MASRPNVTLGRLAELPPEELMVEWARRFGAPAPLLSPELLRLGISYKLQEQKYGGLSRSTRSMLRQASVCGKGGVAKPLPR